MFRYVQRVAEERFNALDLQRTGKVPITPVRSFIKQMSPGATDQQVGGHNPLLDDAYANRDDARAVHMTLIGKKMSISVL